MGHTPFGYRIENGVAVIDEDTAGKLRMLYANYLNGMSLKNAANDAGIETFHASAKRLLMTTSVMTSIQPSLTKKPSTGCRQNGSNALPHSGAWIGSQKEKLRRYRRCLA